jgi:hypothetical protein
MKIILIALFIIGCILFAAAYADMPRRKVYLAISAVIWAAVIMVATLAYR